MEVIGKIKMIGTEQQVSPTFKKRELVVTTDEQYPQHVMIEFVQDKCQLLDNYQPGEGVKVSINIRGREWVSPQGEVKYFNSISGWRVEKLVSEQTPQAPMPTAPSIEAFEPATDFNEEAEDDLPF
jgi:hypothetical protein